jgi:hypothetical protein
MFSVLYNKLGMKPGSVFSMNFSVRVFQYEVSLRVFSSVGVLDQFQIKSELVTRQETHKQDRELGQGAQKEYKRLAGKECAS